MSKRKLCVVTGSRADYGLLYWVMKEIQEDPDLQLQVVATGMHLSPEFGLTYKAIVEDGFDIDAKVEMLLSSDTPVGIAKSIALGISGFAEALDRLKPDILVVLGDRYEILSAAQAALVARIPIAHIAGGDITEGAFDESIRHCLTKMSHLHFVTNAESARRVRQLGENPKCIFNVGSPGLDYIKRLQLLGRKQVESELDFKFKDKNVLVSFHPATLDSQSPTFQFGQLLAALDRLGRDIGVVFTKSNSDPGGRAIGQLIDDYLTAHPNSTAHTTLGQTLYLSTMSHVDALVGNSSSGLYEAPALGKPTVNIGDRQKGRLQPASVINCEASANAIESAIRQALSHKFPSEPSIYGDGNSSIRIKDRLKFVADPTSLLKKRFFDFPTDGE